MSRHDRALQVVILEVKDAIDQGNDPRAVAATLVAGLDGEIVHKLAVEFLVGKAADIAREESLRAERAATHGRVAAETPGAGRRWQSPPRPEPTPEDPEREARRQERIAAEEAAIQRQMWDSISSAIGRYKDALRMEWTDELLASSFALADGTRVLWGEATVEQHRERVGMFTANAATNLQGAARHEAAIESLETAGAACLNELAVSV